MALTLPWNKPKVYPWIVLFFASLNVIFLGGKRRAFGSFVAVFHKEYNISLVELNWIGDSYAAIGCISTSLTISIIIFFNRRYGLFQFMGAVWVLISCFSSAYAPNPLWLFLTHTVFHGIGSSLIISIAGLVVNEYFDKKHRYHIVATTLVSGGSVASILFVTLFADLIDKYTWRHAFIILGILYFMIFALAAMFFRKNESHTEDTAKKAGVCQFVGLISRVQVPLLILWFIERVMTSVVTYGLLLNLTDFLFVHNKNNNLINSTILTILLAAGEAIVYVIGAIVTAITKDLLKGRLKYILVISSMLMGTSLIILEFCQDNQLVLYIFCFLAGVGMGPSNSFLFPAGEEMTRLPGHIAYPFSLAGMGFGMLISPLLTSQIAESLHYKWYFFIQGCLIFFKVVCTLIMMVILRYNEVNLEETRSLLSDKELEPSEILSIMSDITK